MGELSSPDVGGALLDGVLARGPQVGGGVGAREAEDIQCNFCPILELFAQPGVGDVGAVVRHGGPASAGSLQATN